ncbi:uncharacterized protein LOC126906828 [Daktulosphaira vitifoliae]|uniref:uncharacterized protein LOC126906828 n=1 Tax=Daktulosphaira vitifoliae TaxID=58002 RepID=UPI0021AA4FF3|nr:uncharacterized protein LOC126906828 [Daktulosphaira vitifoliae]XP_050543671.1 uncharacterized protein LOC126906828 [Daktulosphaira vitifoliae]
MAEIEAKNSVDDSDNPGDKRKLSPDLNLESNNLTKKFKDSKTQPDNLCQCPQKCSERVPQKSKDELFKMFVEMENEDIQNKFLQKFIEARPVANRLFSKETTANGKLLRRIHCKYRIPSIITDDFLTSINCDSDKDDDSDFDETSSVTSMESKEDSDKLLENDSIESSRKSLGRYNCVDVCQKAFLNLFGLSDKRLKTVRELLIIKARQKHMKRMMEKEENQIEVSLAKDLAQGCLPLMALFNKEDSKKVSDQLMTAISNDINLVNNFFCNQLWKPEYINQKPSD